MVILFFKCKFFFSSTKKHMTKISTGWWLKKQMCILYYIVVRRKAHVESNKDRNRWYFNSNKNTKYPKTLLRTRWIESFQAYDRIENRIIHIGYLLEEEKQLLLIVNIFWTFYFCYIFKQQNTLSFCIFNYYWNKQPSEQQQLRRRNNINHQDIYVYINVVYMNHLYLVHFKA